MKTKLNLIVAAGMVALLWSGKIAQGSFWDSLRNSSESSSRDRQYDRNDSQPRYDDRYDSRSRDDDRYDSRRRDDDRSSSRRDRGSNDPDMIVRRAYQDVLNRDPDQEGMRTYRSKIIDDRWSEQDVRNDLRRSAERSGRTPASADMIIRRAYQDILGRDPDQVGLSNYRSKLLYQNWTENDVRSDLKKSQERRETGGISNDQAQQMVRRAYQSVLGRDPDSSGNALYVQKIRQNHWSENDVANELRKSPEYRNKHR